MKILKYNKCGRSWHDTGYKVTIEGSYLIINGTRIARLRMISNALLIALKNEMVAVVNIPSGYGIFELRNCKGHAGLFVNGELVLDIGVLNGKLTLSITTNAKDIFADKRVELDVLQ